MNNLINDLKFAIRNLSKSPGFVAVAVLTLALGIGLNSAIFSIVNMVLFQPLPYANSDRIVNVERYDLESGNSIGNPYPIFEEIRDRQTSFEHLVAWSITQTALGRGDNAGIHMTQLVSGDYFHALGVQPALGRLLSRDDDRIPRAHPVVVLGHSFWQRQFNGETGIVGRIVALNGHDFTVIGVAPEGFNGLTTMLETELWVPMMMQPVIEESPNALEDYQISWMAVSGVLKPDIDLDLANAELALISTQLHESDPELYGDSRASAYHMSGLGLNSQDRMAASLLIALVMVLVGSILLIACANVANLLLARSTVRRREIGIRLALGSPRGRIVRQLLCESLILAMAGGLIGLLFATWVMNAAVWFLPQIPMSIIPSLDFQIDWRVLVFALGLSGLTGVVFGLVPSFQATKIDLIPALKDEDGGTGGIKRSRLRHSLIVGQVAISMVLLVTAGLFVRSLINSKLVDPGFEHRSTLSMILRLDSNRYDETSGRVFYNRLIDQVRELPGVEAACLDYAPPLGLFVRGWYSFVLEGDRPDGVDGEYIRRSSWGSVISPGECETLDIPLLMGRDFDDRDLPKSPRVVMINEVFAKTYWPDENPLGQRLRFLDDGDGKGDGELEFAEVIGVVKTIKHTPYGERPQSFIYQPLSQVWKPEVTMLVRGSGEPMAMLPAVRNVLSEIDPIVVPLDTRAYSEIISFVFMPSMITASLCSFFGVMALLLSMVGLYSVMSFMVAQRTKEIGIRMAIGARSGDVMKLVMRQGLMLTGIGLGIGLILALGFTRVLASMLYKVNPSDPATFVTIPLLLLLVSTLAIYLPARRAMKVDPMIALRTE